MLARDPVVFYTRDNHQRGRCGWLRSISAELQKKQFHTQLRILETGDGAKASLLPPAKNLDSASALKPRHQLVAETPLVGD